jgi:hypothetical protein
MCGETKRRDTLGTMIAWLTLGFLLLTAAGCVRPDWIEQTLVTVDVTGTWRGNYKSSTVFTGGDVELTLMQKGPKVTGQMSGGQWVVIGGSVPIEGTVNGDTFRFHDTRGTVTGLLQVSGDEMSGSGTSKDSIPMTITLRRQP